MLCFTKRLDVLNLPDFTNILLPTWIQWSRSYRFLSLSYESVGIGEGSLQHVLSSAPLKVYLGLKPSAIPERLLESIASESSRFEELHIDSDLWQSDGGPLGAIFQRFTSPAPMLQSLSLVTHGRDFPGGALPHMFSDQMPCLRKLCLKHFTSWPRDYFQGLTHLCLYDQESTRPTMDEFLDFLENSPLLEELALVRAGPLRLETGAQSHIPSSRLVSLPRLRQLDIGEWPSSLLVARFLSHIHLPFQTNMYFWGNSMLNGINPDSNTASGLSLLLPEDISKLENMKHIKKWYLARQPRVILDTPFVSLTSDPGKSGSRTLYIKSDCQRQLHEN
ncbi:hypothetical protein GYMLUDRAFT_621994 [Collybiopsis luxurians FD-317 M1]|nr:hypothetical protein GYMLUDRAFT_621994 [Collybiopsis luxurians FD-317 M1]